MAPGRVPTIPATGAIFSQTAKIRRAIRPDEERRASTRRTTTPTRKNDANRPRGCCADVDRDRDRQQDVNVIVTSIRLQRDRHRLRR